MAVSNANSAEVEDQRDRTRGEIEVLILISGLILTPLLYLWQQSLTILQINLPQWQAYLAGKLGSQYSLSDVIVAYFSPFGLSKALPTDLMIWAYDITVVMATISLLIFGAALVAIESRDLKRVQKLVQKGKSYLDLVLLMIIFFVIFHLLTTTIFPFRMLFGMGDVWTLLGISLVAAIILKKWLNRHINTLLNTKTGP